MVNLRILLTYPQDHSGDLAVTKRQDRVLAVRILPTIISRARYGREKKELEEIAKRSRTLGGTDLAPLNGYPAV